MVLYTVVPDPADAAVIIQTLRPGAREFLHDLDASVMRLYRAGAADPGVSRVIVVIALWAHVIPVAVPGHVDTVGDDAPLQTGEAGKSGSVGRLESGQGYAAPHQSCPRIAAHRSPAASGPTARRCGDRSGGSSVNTGRRDP